MTPDARDRAAPSTGAANYPLALSPFRIGKVEIRNRIFIPAHTTNFAVDFMPTQRHVDYHRERAEGGVGLIFVEPMRIHRTALGRAGGIYGGDDRSLPGLQAITRAIRDAGTVPFVQITHTGRHSDNFTDRLPPWAPSSIPWSTSGEFPHAMTHREIGIIRDAYVDTAKRAVRAGFEGMEVHFGHGHLLHQFLSPLTNTRTDDYGGSDDNRARFPLEVLRAVLDAVGHLVPVGARISVDELMPGGLNVEASRDITALLAAQPGVAFINASVSAYAWPSIGYHLADMSHPKHLFMEQSAALRPVIGTLPLLTANRYTSLDDAEEGLATGALDMIGMNRAHMADPNLIAKALQGRQADTRPCVSSNFCIGQIAFHRPIACMMNPRVGNEAVWKEEPPKAALSKKVLVVGGGPAGLEFSRIAATRGHDVTLWERSDRLGGLLNIGGTATSRGDLHKMQRYLEKNITEAGVTVKLRQAGDADSIAAQGADVVILAIGAVPVTPSIPGWQRAQSVAQALAAPRDSWAGTSVCVHDMSGSWGSLAVIETLAASGAAVTYLCGPESVLWDINIYSRMTAMDRLAKLKVRLRAGVRVTSAGNGVVTLVDKGTGDVSEIGPFTTLIESSRGISELALLEDLESRGIAVHAIGDALAPHSLLEAVYDGHALARTL